MAAKLSRPALRLLSRPAACVGCQLVQLHGAGNRPPTHRGGGVRGSRSRHVLWSTPQSESRGAHAGQRLVVRGGELSCEAETCRARQKVVMRGGDLLCEVESCRRGPSSGELVRDAPKA
jgi:hypothetical protein